jgi:hypothetical protein
MGFFRAQIMRQLRERREVGKQHRDLDHPSLFDMGAATRADIWIARAAPDAENSVNCTGGAGQQGAADAALCGEVNSGSNLHRITSNVGVAALSM